MIEIAFVIFAVSHAIVIMFFERQRKEIATLHQTVNSQKAKIRELKIRELDGLLEIAIETLQQK